MPGFDGKGPKGDGPKKQNKGMPMRDGSGRGQGRRVGRGGGKGQGRRAGRRGK